MLTGAWPGILDSGSNETDNWRRRRWAMTKAVWSTPTAKNVFDCAYRAEHLTRAGTIAAARGQMHSPNQDLKALCSKSAIEAPEEHRAYWSLRRPNRGGMIPSVSATNRSRR